MRDLIGNQLREGSIVWWISKQLPLKVRSIDAGGLSIDGHGRDVTPARITLEITIPVQPMQDGSETQFTDFLCTMNPDVEQLIEGLMGQVKRDGRPQ